nr:hypothetical protein [Rhodococcus ruber]
MIVDAGLLTTLVARLTDTLHFGKERFADKCRVATGVLDTLESDGACVVAVLQHRGDERVRDGSAGAIRPGHGGHAAFVELVLDHAGCPLAGGVALEHPGDPMAARRVDHDGLYFPPVISTDAAVEIAERCHARRAAALRLLEHALARFGGQIATVELGDRTHDAVQQHPARCFIDVL